MTSITLCGQRVIVDADLAALYDVPTKRFNEAVKRNLIKFPADFMFTLSDEEFAALRSQSATSNTATQAPGGLSEHNGVLHAVDLWHQC